MYQAALTKWLVHALNISMSFVLQCIVCRAPVPYAVASMALRIRLITQMLSLVQRYCNIPQLAQCT